MSCSRVQRSGATPVFSNVTAGLIHGEAVKVVEWDRRGFGMRFYLLLDWKVGEERESSFCGRGNDFWCMSRYFEHCVDGISFVKPQGRHRRMRFHILRLRWATSDLIRIMFHFST